MRDGRSEEAAIERRFAIGRLAALALLAFSGIAAALALPPDARVAIHWSVSGEPDLFVGKWPAFLAAPCLLILLWVILLASSARQGPTSPSPDATSHGSRFDQVWPTGFALLALFQAIIVASAFGFATGRPQWLPLLLGAIIIIAGLRMPYVGRNRWFGIRTPWTLADPEVWAKTHRFGRFVLLAAGALILLLALFGFPENLIGSTALLIVAIAAVICAVYSWWISS